MARQSNNIIRRGKKYSVRVMIPKDLRHFYRGAREKLKALGTSNYQTAKLDGFYAVAEILSEFDHVRTHGALRSPCAVENEVAVPAVERDDAGTFEKSAYSSKLFENSSVSAAQKVPTILEAFEMYVADNPGGVSADTFRQSRYIVGLFSQFLGKNPLVNMITKATVRDWRRALAEWPVKANEVAELKGLPFPEAILVARALWGVGVRPCISDKTVNKYLSALGGFCTWAVAETEYLESNPVRGLYLKLDKMEIKVRSFTAAELTTFFQSPVYTGCQSIEDDFLPGAIKPRDFRYWLPLIALYSGARMGEISQLLVDDVKQLHGTWVLHITREGSTEKRTKTRGSQRIVPVHSALIRLGLLEYRESQVQAGSLVMFPDIEKDARGQISGRPSRWFGRYMAKIKLRDGNKLNFHSFRHTAADALRRADYTNEQIAPLLGHTQATMTGRYGTEPVGTVNQRAQMIEAIAYDLDFSPLLPRLAASPAVAEAA